MAKDLGALEALDLGVLMAPGTLQATVLHQMLTVVQHNKITQARAASEVVASAAVAALAVVASAVASVAAKEAASAVAREEVSVEMVQRNHFAHQAFSPTHSAARPMLVACLRLPARLVSDPMALLSSDAADNPLQHQTTHAT